MKYAFDYHSRTPYGHIIGLIEEHVQPGLVIDLGCGNAAIAEPLSELGFGYVGLDVDPTTLSVLADRGIEAHFVDLARTDELSATIHRIVGGRAVAAITALDVIEHLAHPLDALHAIHDAMSLTGATWLGVSIPNVTHFDLAAKLLAGRWDVTSTGLLDETHVSLFSEGRLRQTMATAGFAPGPSADFLMLHSDQSFPADLTTMSPATPLGRLLRFLRAGADDHGATNQFVRLYRLAEAPAAVSVTPAERTPFLTVMVRSRGTRTTLADTLTCLAGQSVDDFEVLLLVDTTSDDDYRAATAQLDAFDDTFRNRVRVERLDASNRVVGLNLGVELAVGRYIVILDDDDLVFANWVEVFQQTAAHAGGAILRSRCVVQHVMRSISKVSDVEPVSGFQMPYDSAFDFIDHLRSSQTPPHTTAFPIEVFRSFGLRYNLELPVYEDLDVLLRAAVLCGVVSTEAITAVYRRWDDAEATIHAVPWSEWEHAKHRILHDMDQLPLLLPEGSASRLFYMAGAQQELQSLRDRVEAAEAQVYAFEHSRVWKATKPVRVALQSTTIRRVGDRALRVVRRHPEAT